MVKKKRASTKVSRTKSAKRKSTKRVKDATATRKNIVDEALREFSQKGFGGARVDRIAANTDTSKRMIYYYFDSKEGLYLEVLKESYKRIRVLESAFHLEDLPPILALRKLVELTVDYQATHADFIRVIMTENIQQGIHIKQLPELRKLNRQIIELISDLCKRGIADGVFRDDFDPVDLHMTISALSFFNVSNQHTFGYIFQRNFADKSVHAARREEIVETVLRYVRAS